MITAILVILLAIPLALFAAFGAVAAVIALVAGFFMVLFAAIVKTFIVPWFDKRENQRLDENHILVLPQVQQVRFDYYSGYFVIDCRYTDPDTGREFIFSSQPFPDDPSEKLKNVQLGVFVNPVDYSNYYVDVSKLFTL